MPDRSSWDKDYAQFEAQLRAQANRKEVLDTQGPSHSTYAAQVNRHSGRRASLSYVSQLSDHPRSQPSIPSQRPSQKVQFTPSVDDRELSKSSACRGRKGTIGQTRKLKKAGRDEPEVHSGVNQQRHSGWLSKLRVPSGGLPRPSKANGHHVVSIFVSASLAKAKNDQLTYRQPKKSIHHAPHDGLAPGTGGPATQYQRHSRTYCGAQPSPPTTMPISPALETSTKLPPSTSYTPTMSSRSKSAAAHSATHPSAPQQASDQQPPIFHRTLHGPTSSFPHHNMVASTTQAGPAHLPNYTATNLPQPAPHPLQSQYLHQNPVPQIQQQHHDQTQQYHNSFVRHFNARHYQPSPDDPYWKLVPPNSTGPKLQLDQVIAAASSHSKPHAAMNHPSKVVAGHPPKGVSRKAENTVPSPTARTPAQKKPPSKPPVPSENKATVQNNKTSGKAVQESSKDSAVSGNSSRIGTRDAAGRPWGPKWDDASGKVVWGHW
jgi:hypothetical protein